MKRLKLPKSFTLNDVFVYVALLCVSSYALLEHMSISIGAFSSLKLPMMYLGMICLVTQIKPIGRCIFRRNQFKMLLTLAVFCVMLVISMFVNRDAAFGESPLRNTFRLLLYLVELFLLMIVLAETGRGKAAISFLFWYVAAITLINDVLMFSGFIRFGTGRFETYLVGSKFSVSYLHMYLLTLWAIRSKWQSRKHRLSKWMVLLAAAYIVGMAVRVDCMTGIIGCAALVILFGMVDSKRRSRLLRFTSPMILMLTLVASVVFVLLVDMILELPFVQFIIEDVLGRDLTLTGRTNIYNVYFKTMEGRMLWGVGFGGANEASVSLFGYENVQNALLQWVLQVGIPATVGLAAVMYQAFRQIHRKKLHNMNMILPLVALIYMYVILGTVETTFNMAFIMWIALIFMLANEKQKQLPQAAAAARASQ